MQNLPIYPSNYLRKNNKTSKKTQDNSHMKILCSKERETLVSRLIYNRKQKVHWKLCTNTNVQNRNFR